MKCPLCHSTHRKHLLQLKCGNLDGSLIYKTAKVFECESCGHIYNILSKAAIRDLERYYEAEAASGNVNPLDAVSDRPGSNSVFAMQRYSKLYDFMAAYIKSTMRVLDAGCATGGFLDYLQANKFSKLYGFDMSKQFINQAKQKPHDVKLGKMKNIPFNKESMDVVVLDQTMEHLMNPQEAIAESRRVLDTDGLLCISVPDAARYDKEYFFDFFWFLIREHVQHFDLEHMRILVERQGFRFLGYEAYRTPMMNEQMILPVLSMMFRKTELNRGQKQGTRLDSHSFALGRKLRRYVAEHSKMLDKKKNIIQKLIASKLPVYVWGTGREFMYLYESAGLKECNLISILDMSKNKQKHYSIDGKKIEDPSVLTNVSENSVLAITAVAHTDSIAMSAKKMGYRGEIATFN